MLSLLGLVLSTVQPATADDFRCPYYYPAVVGPDWLPNQAEWLRAADLVQEMLIAELAGASLVGNYAGDLQHQTEADAVLNQKSLGSPDAAIGIRSLGLIGVTLFSQNADSGKTAATQIAELGDQLPYFFTAVDQEGGSVVRLRNDIEPPIPAARLGEIADATVARESARLSAEQLRAAGINVVFAPVADIETAKTESSLAKRTFGKDSQLAAELVGATVQGYASAGVLPTLKHFPGLGGISTDTHNSAGTYTGSFAKLCNHHLKPFAAGIAAGAPIVMLGHAVYPMYGKLPASANPKIIRELLREDLSFRGIVITDSMAMAAASTAISGRQNVWVRSLKAGADLLLMPSNSVRAKTAIAKALTNGNLSVIERRAALTRVFAWLMANERNVSELPTYPAGSSVLKEAAIDFRKSLD